MILIVVPLTVIQLEMELSSEFLDTTYVWTVQQELGTKDTTGAVTVTVFSRFK